MSPVLETLPRTFHTAINNADQIVGRVNMSSTSNDWYGTIWNGTTAPTLESGTVLAINNNGKAAGAAMYSGGELNRRPAGIK
ncbi:MAG: hypothetical protein Q7J20_03235 [Candidatus Nitrotoga sp.]|nr:hypothetical protein [Candidatus Nitrotoga sp.]MDO9446914.1 hypothetical protein [Candidatus Nitrotoga sp.]